MLQRCISLMLAGVMVASVATSAGEVMRREWSRNRSFTVTIEADDDGGGMTLYGARSSKGPWSEVGRCESLRDPSGAVYHTRTVRVPEDGTYYYTVAGSDREDNAISPRMGEDARLKVDVDTIPPTITLVTPAEWQEVRALENVVFRWKVVDDALHPDGVSITYSTNNGGSWRDINHRLADEGSLVWQVPEEAYGPVVISVSARDRAGNFRRRLTRIRVLDPRKTTREDRILPKPIPDPEPIPETAPDPEPEPEEIVRADPHEPSRAALIAFTMAGNLVRQGRLKDALRYYMTALDSDPEYEQAMSAAALVYSRLGRYERAIDLITKATKRLPAAPYLRHNKGRIHQSWADALVEAEMDAEPQINAAIDAYAKAIDLAEAQNTTADRAASYFRLGEICYRHNQDIHGARLYWEKILDLHAATPEVFEPRPVYERHTASKVNLFTWQRWAVEYLRQLDAMYGPVDVAAPPPASPPAASPRRDTGSDASVRDRRSFPDTSRRTPAAARNTPRTDLPRNLYGE